MTSSTASQRFARPPRSKAIFHRLFIPIAFGVLLSGPIATADSPLWDGHGGPAELLLRSALIEPVHPLDTRLLLADVLPQQGKCPEAMPLYLQIIEERGTGEQRAREGLKACGGDVPLLGQPDGGAAEAAHRDLGGSPGESYCPVTGGDDGRRECQPPSTIATFLKTLKRDVTNSSLSRFALVGFDLGGKGGVQIVAEASSTGNVVVDPLDVVYFQAHGHSLASSRGAPWASRLGLFFSDRHRPIVAWVAPSVSGVLAGLAARRSLSGDFQPDRHGLSGADLLGSSSGLGGLAGGASWAAPSVPMMQEVVHV